ncbi:hypothetical protein YYE_03451 [Plasmodium vinckei vinckei]|nr:hypothetical protein YYE_03451 [Plasmodium vinckei vinckei]
MKITELINTLYTITKDICLYVLYYVVILLIATETIFFIVFIKSRYKKFKIYKAIQNYRNEIDTLPQQNILHKLIKYIPKDEPEHKDKDAQQNNYIFYYLKRSTFFLQNYKYLHLKKILNYLFVRNNIIDVKTIKSMTHLDVIQFKKDFLGCMHPVVYRTLKWKKKWNHN